MNLLRRLIAAFTLAALLIPATPSLAAPAVKGQSDGTFVGISQSDYAYLRLKVGKGREESFFILKPDSSVQAFLDNPRKLRGRKLRVFWEQRDQEIPEAGIKQRIKHVLRVEEQK